MVGRLSVCRLNSFWEGGCVGICLLGEKLDWVDELVRLYRKSQKRRKKGLTGVPGINSLVSFHLQS